MLEGMTIIVLYSQHSSSSYKYHRASASKAEHRITLLRAFLNPVLALCLALLLKIGRWKERIHTQAGGAGDVDLIYPASTYTQTS